MTTKSQSQEVLDILYNSTYIQNINKGKIESPTGEFFGTTNQQGMAYPRDSLYNKPNTFHADMTNSQANYRTPQLAKVI